MIFNEPAYFAALAVAVLAFRFLAPAGRPWWLFLTGTAFYVAVSPSFAGVLAVEVALVFGLGWFIRRDVHRRLAFALGLISVIGLLVVYKYLGLLASTADAVVGLAGHPGLPGIAELALPLAISFFTFEFVHYLVDAYHDTLPEHDLADFLAFAMFAPTMVAGPIKRFQGFNAQVRGARATPEDVSAGIQRILIGLFKKIVLADTFALWVTPLTSSDAVEFATRPELIVALLAYAFRIYLDFSGYSDIAIGSARLFGITVPENFRWPYLRRNIAEFWRSWHMSLTTWVMDYIYKPLGGNRRGLARTCANLVAALAVCGIWHGAAWNFLVWGLYHGTLLAGHRVWTQALRPRVERRLLPAASDHPVRRVLATVGPAAGGLLTFSLVTLGWGLFVMPVQRFWLLLGQIL